MPILKSYTKKIVCLANSRKPTGRCVAGREITDSGFGSWVRPVSARPGQGQAISLKERQYRDGQDPSLLDIISIEMKGPQPQHHQQENHLIADRPWVKQGRIGWQRLQPAVEDPAGPLWLNGHSTRYGENDQVPEAHIDSLSRSLYLVRPEKLTLVVASEGGTFGQPRRRVRARFHLCDHSYCIVVTDPWAETKYSAEDDGSYLVANALLCISLGEPIRGYAYKLAAAVITPQRTDT